ncbi:MAG TPA: sigma-70 family RNA polymerase sigma factor [Bacteroidota bacterium]|nr:sigma-70 family RNA polymerase sigma factor [Bacteroidota bacterium]
MQKPILFLNSDARILETLRAGKEHALLELFQQNRQSIRSLVMKNHGNEDDAEDILQDALIVFWEQIRSGKFIYEAKLSTYIYGISKNLWMRRLYKKKRELPMPDDEPDWRDDAQTPLEELIATEESNSVAQAMERIGSPCKEVLLMYYWEERSMEEIAEALHFSNADTAKSKKYQCKKTLELLIKKQLQGVVQ